MIKIKIYGLLAFLFWIVRQFVIPNPFDVLSEGITITISGSSILLSPDILNLIADPIIGAITFGIVGLYYIRRSDPAFGSLLYMVFYVIHIGLMYLILSVYPLVWLMALIGIFYIGIHIAIIILRYKLD